jgi:peptide/nickel transport system substrate-binding protein
MALVAVACGGDDGDGASGSGSEPAADAADGDADGAAANADEVCTEDRAGGEITMGVPSPITGLDPIVVPAYSNVSGATNLLLMNAGIGGSTAPTTDLRVRQGIAYALDLETINDRAEGGEGLPTSLLAHESMAIAPGVEELPFDPDRARELLDDVKAETGWDGSIRLLGGDTPVAQETTIVIEALLEAVGLQVQPENLPTEVVNERVIFQPNYDLALFSMSLFEESPMARLNQWFTDSPRSRNGYSDPAMDEALTQVQRAVTREEKQEAMTAVQEVWNETIPSAVLFAREDFIAYKDEVKGLRFSRDSTPVFHTAYIGQ